MVKQKIKPLFQLEKLVLSLVSTPKHFVSLAISRKSNAIKHLPDKENLINLVWKRCVILYLLTLKHQKIRKQTLYTLEFPLKNKWTTFLDKLNSSNNEVLNTLHMYLFQTLVQELISNDAAYRITLAYKELSEKLLLPTEIDLVGLDSNSFNSSLKKQVGKSPFLMMNETKVQNKNLLKTYYQLSTSTVVNRWENEVTSPKLQQKALKIKLKPTVNQRNIIDEWINTSNYVYNKTVETIKKGHQINFQSLRDKLVTKNTKKNHTEYKTLSDNIKKMSMKRLEIKKELEKMLKTQNLQATDLQKSFDEITFTIKEQNKVLRDTAKTLTSELNTNIKKWESKTPKEVRAGAVNDVCKAYKTGFSNLKAGTIKFFRLGFRKHLNISKNVLIPKNFVNIIDGYIRLAPDFFKDECKFKMGKRTLRKYSNLVIKNDCRIVKQKKEYWIVIPIPVEVESKKRAINYCGIDPGSRTFMTTFGNNGCFEYKHNNTLLKKLNMKINILKSFRTRPRLQKQRNKYRKKCLNKVENRKNNLISELHWKVINDLLMRNDYIFYGDIKSHDIVKNGVNRTLNKNLNDLKLYKFKERLFYKASERNKQVFAINEAYTTQTCSFCGSMYKPGSSEIYKCVSCSRNIGRDVNASKNILMKGIMSCLA